MVSHWPPIKDKDGSLKSQLNMLYIYPVLGLTFYSQEKKLNKYFRGLPWGEGIFFNLEVLSDYSFQILQHRITQLPETSKPINKIEACKTLSCSSLKYDVLSSEFGSRVHIFHLHIQNFLVQHILDQISQIPD